MDEDKANNQTSTSTTKFHVVDTSTGTQETQAPKKKRSVFRSVLITLLTLFILALGGLLGGRAYLQEQLSPISESAQIVAFEVLPGWGANRVALELEEAGLIRNARIFSLYLRFNELDTQIGEGLYDLDSAMSAAELAQALAQGGRPRTVRMVIPEGFRIQDIVLRLSETGLADEATFNNLIRNPSSTNTLIDNAETLEGYLFPASYDIPVKSTADEVITIMLSRFEQELNADIQAELDAQGLSVNDWVVLASMIQSEAANTDEMPIISGVFRNRLDIGMALQSDPTVAYGLGKDLPELDFSAGDFDVDHPWNTYTRAGLPATPISNPGSDALKAVLAPQRQNEDGVDYLYFLHGFDSDQKVFRPNTNLNDHNRDVQRYLR